jgi:drug/metabolite transporter (DMT)-like permease
VSSKGNATPITGILSGALVWGLIWYPYRVLGESGVSGPLATMLSYLFALCFGLALLPRIWHEVRLGGWWMAALVICAGWSNFGYVLAILDGEVMRVLLLFYLAPLWTILFSYLILGERLNRWGVAVIALSLCGAFIMLWRPKLGLPLPRNGSEWAGMSAGMSFALSNVVARRAENLSVTAKSNSVLFGTILCTTPFLMWKGGLLEQMAAIPLQSWLILLMLGVVLCSTSYAVQFGLAVLAANRVIILFLSELVFAGVASYFLADEAMEFRDWIGASLIVSASMLSGRLYVPVAASEPSDTERQATI